jgi:hypothetical protein
VPNFLTRDLEIMFENVIDGFDAACVISREADTSYPDAQSMQRSNDVFYRPQEYRTNIVTGIDISGQADTDIIQRQVPTTFRTPDNVRFSLNFLENRDPSYFERMGKGAALDLAASVDNAVYSTVAAQASIVVRKIGAIAANDVATAESLMLMRGIGAGRQRKMFFNPLDYQVIAQELGGRAYMGPITEDAYTRSRVPDVAGFTTFRTDSVANLAAIGTVTGTTVNGNQSFTPSAMTGDLPTDNRRMTLVVAGANIANTKNGDCFTIAGVNALHNVNKTDTGQLQTFRIISGAGTVNLVITPAIISAGPYRNVSAQAGTGAAVTFLNNVTRPVNAFWAHGAVTLDYGDIKPQKSAGVEWMTARTKNGVPIAMGVSQGLMTGLISVRFITRYATTVLDPESCGILIANQT